MSPSTPRSPRSYPVVSPSDVLSFEKPTKGELANAHCAFAVEWGRVLRWFAVPLAEVAPLVDVDGNARSGKSATGVASGTLGKSELHRRLC